MKTSRVVYFFDKQKAKLSRNMLTVSIQKCERITKFKRFLLKNPENDGADESNGDKMAVERGAEEVILMPNGCVCCTAADDLESTFEMLMMLGSYDVIVIESTGVAEPREVKRNFKKMKKDGRFESYLHILNFEEPDEE